MHTTVVVRDTSRLADLLQTISDAAGTGLLVEIHSVPPGADLGEWCLALTHRARVRGLPLAYVAVGHLSEATAHRIRGNRFQSVAKAEHWLATARAATPRRNGAIIPRGSPGNRRVDRSRAPVLSQTPGGWVRNLFGVAVFCAIAGSALWLFLTHVQPSATLTVAPSSQILELDVPMSASLYAQTVDNDTGLVPATWISVSHEVVGTTETTAVTRRPVDKARGYLAITNLGTEGFTIPAGTQVQTGTGDAIPFVTLDDAILAGGSGLQALVEIEAVEAGEEGNVPANSINTITGSWAQRVRIANPSDLAGGTSEERFAVSQRDQDYLRDVLLADVRGKALTILAPEVPPNAWLPSETVSVSIQWTNTELFNGEVADELTLTMMVLVSGLAVQTSDLVDFVLARLEAETPPRALIDPDSLDFHLESGTVNAGTGLAFTVKTRARYLQAPDRQVLRTTLAGTPLADLDRKLAELDIEEPWQIHISPPERETLPSLPHRIRVETSWPAASATDS